MVQEVVTVFLLGHITGDFYLQSSSLAEKKEKSGKTLVLHGVLYLISVAGVSIIVFGTELLIWCIGISAIHLMLDFIKICVKNKFGSCEGEKISAYLYLTDQFLHILTILTAGVVINIGDETYVHTTFIRLLADSFNLDMNRCFSMLLAIMTVIKPCSITIRVILSGYRIAENTAGVKNAGALIGILERLILLMLLSVGQYGAIGFVLTAKSVARYNKIAEDPKFGEYYLLGTLLSSMLVIAVYMLILN